MISHKSFYNIYKQGAEERALWEHANMPKIEKSLKILENCRHEPYDNIKNAVYALDGYAQYSLTKLVPLSEEVSAELFSSLESRYDFKLLEISSGFSNIRFISRAVISESDPSTNMTFSADLGLFETRIQFRDRLSKAPLAVGASSATSNPKEQNKPVEISGIKCYHPHISSSNNLCLGSYGGSNGAMSTDQKNYNIMGIFYNLCSLLCRYNANSLNFGGAYINNWIGHKCAICFEFAPNAIKCEKSKNMIHAECAELIDGKYYGLDQIKKCSKCGEKSPFYIVYSKDNIVCSKCEEKENNNE